MIAFILELIAGNLLEFAGGAIGVMAFVFGSVFTGGRAKRKQAEMKADMLEKHIEKLEEVRRESKDELISRISRPE